MSVTAAMSAAAVPTATAMSMPAEPIAPVVIAVPVPVVGPATSASAPDADCSVYRQIAGVISVAGIRVIGLSVAVIRIIGLSVPVAVPRRDCTTSQHHNDSKCQTNFEHDDRPQCP